MATAAEHRAAVIEAFLPSEMVGLQNYMSGVGFL